jgi:hypothetical protein
VKGGEHKKMMKNDSRLEKEREWNIETIEKRGWGFTVSHVASLFDDRSILLHGM